MNIGLETELSWNCVKIKKRRVEGELSKTAVKAIDSSDGRILELMKENSNISVSEISRWVGLGMTIVTKGNKWILCNKRE